MKQTEKPISDIQQLADEGWLHIMELLPKDALTQ
jgi:hypothetical protein